MPGGRPRDPRVDRLVIDAVHAILAERGLDAVTASAIVERAGVGRAALYRRWPDMDAVIAVAVRDLGVRAGDIEWGPIVGGRNVWADITATVYAITVGTRADAVRAVMGSLRSKPDIRRAYAAGPAAATATAIDAVMHRSIDRGDAADWPGGSRIIAAIAAVHYVYLTTGAPTVDVPYVVGDILGRAR